MHLGCTCGTMWTTFPGGHYGIPARELRARDGVTQGGAFVFTGALGTVRRTNPAALTRHRDGVPARGDGARRGVTEVVVIHNTRIRTVITAD